MSSALLDKLPAQLQPYARKLDNELNKIPLAVEFEKKTQVPKVFVAGGKNHHIIQLCTFFTMSYLHITTMSYPLNII